MIVLKYPLKVVHKAPSIFPFLTVRTKFCSADEVAQLDASVVVNMKVNVKEVHLPQDIGGLINRCCDCSSGDCDFQIEVLGEMAKQAPSVGPGALLGFRLSEYQGNWTLTSTPLAATCQISAAEVPGRSADDAVVRQGLKKCTLREATVDEIVRGLQDKETAQVKARLCPFTDGDIFHTNFVYDDMKFRLYVAFYGDAGKFFGDGRSGGQREIKRRNEF